MLKIYNTLTRDKQDFVPMRLGLGLGLAQREADDTFAVSDCGCLTEGAPGKRPAQENAEDI